MKNIEDNLSKGMSGKSALFFPFLLIALAFLPMKKAAHAQGPPNVEEVRGAVDLNSHDSVDSLFAFNKRNNNLLASSSIMPIDTGGNATVPGYRFVIEGQAGVTQGDTLYFKAKDTSDLEYGLRPEDGSIITFERGRIRRVDMKVYSTDVKYEEDNNFPRGFELSQNYPNPFNSSTQINYSLARPGRVSLKVYNLLGRNVQTLVEELQQKAGEYGVSVNLEDLASGMYFYRLSVNRGESEESSVKKMSLVK